MGNPEVLPFVHHIGSLLTLRGLQGFGVAGSSAITKSIINDYYQGAQRKHAFSFLGSAWGTGIIVAPFIGGYLQHYLGWKASFYFFTLYGLALIFVCVFFLPETHHQRTSIHPSVIASQLKRMLSYRYFWTGVLLAGMGYGMVIIFSVIAPHLIQHVLGYSAVTYGHIALFVGAAWVLGSSANRYLMRHTTINTIISSCTLVLIIIAALNLFLGYSLGLNLYLFIIPVFAIIFVGACYYPICTAINIIIFSDIAGIASAMVGVIGFSITALCGIIASTLNIYNQIDAGWFYLILTILSAIVFLVNRFPKDFEHK